MKKAILFVVIFGLLLAISPGGMFCHPGDVHLVALWEAAK